MLGKTRQAALLGIVASTIVYATPEIFRADGLDLDKHDVAAVTDVPVDTPPDPGAASVASERQGGIPGPRTVEGVESRDGADAAIARAIISIVSSDPPNCAIDARQPTDPDGTNPRGFSSIDVTFNGDPAGLGPGDFLVTLVPAGGIAPTIVSVVQLGGNTVRLVLSTPVPRQKWTKFTHLASGTFTSLGYLPCDVNGNGTSNASDITALIDVLNNLITRPIYATDINRTAVAEPSDVLRLNELLGGCGAFDPWLGATLPACP